MIGRLLRLPFVLTALLTAGVDPVSAQSTAMPRGDAAGFLGRQGAHIGSSDPQDRTYWHHSNVGGGSAGLYWTGHLKTEIDFSISRTADAFVSRRIPVENYFIYRTSRLDVSRRSLGFSQQYQFFENTWFHPQVAAGMSLTWEQRTKFPPAPIFDPFAQPAMAEEQLGEIEHTTTLTIRPFVSGGFKAYVTPRWFFRADIRAAFKGGIDEGQVRVGFGRDW